MTVPTTTEMLRAAARYAASDPSDPFALRRAITHLNNGVASYATQNGSMGYYDAEEYTETRRLALPNGKTLEWQATAYKNVKRP